MIDSDLEQIVLRFSGMAAPAGEGFVILDPAGVMRTPNSVTADENNMVWKVGFNPPLAGGTVGVRWTVQAADAHPIEGSFSFTVAAATRSIDPGDAPAEAAGVGGASAADGADGSVTDGAVGATDGDDTAEVAAAGAAHSADQPEGISTSETDQAASSAAVPTDTGQEDLDSFLSVVDAGTPYAKGLGAFGRFLGFIGTILGLGSVAFVASVLRGHRQDALMILRLVRYSMVLIVIGSVVNAVAQLAMSGGGWSAIFSTNTFESTMGSSYGLAIGLRIAGAVLLFAAAAVAAGNVPAASRDLQKRTETLAAVGASIGASGESKGEVDLDDVATADPSADNGPAAGLDRDDSSRSGASTTAGMPITGGMALAIATLLLSFTFDGHTVTEGNRLVTGLVDMIHVGAGAIWGGGVLALATVLWHRHRRGDRLDAFELGTRFAVPAGAGLAVAGIAGIALAVTILDGISELWSTPWGLLLVGKFAAVAVAAAVGTYNHFVIVPWLDTDPLDDGRSNRLRKTATAEALLVCIVLAVVAVLVAASR